jgi:hypothetical protein
MGPEQGSGRHKRLINLAVAFPQLLLRCYQHGSLQDTEEKPSPMPQFCRARKFILKTSSSRSS